MLSCRSSDSGGGTEKLDRRGGERAQCDAPFQIAWPPVCCPAGALVAQLDRAPDFESGGREFESLRARQKLSPQTLRRRIEFGTFPFLTVLGERLVSHIRADIPAHNRPSPKARR